MKRRLYIKPIAAIVHVNAKGDIMNAYMGNDSGTHASGDYEGDGQAAKRNTLTNEEEGWDTFPKQCNLWDD